MISWLDRLTTGTLMASKPPLPPFNFKAALQKARAFEDGWHTRAEFFKGRALSESGL
jgi:nuclear transport factor 2 (NTF2) superfamily protein